VTSKLYSAGSNSICILRSARAQTLSMASAALMQVSCDSGTYVVSSTVDGAPGSLRAAVAQANRSTAAAIRIELPSGTYELTTCESEDDSNMAGDLDLTTSAPVGIVGTGPNVVIRQTCPGRRVLDSHGSARLTLTDVTITGGSLVETDPAVPARGGGVRAASDVVSEASIISDNSATGAPGRSAASGGTPIGGGAVYGGGLYVSGSLSGRLVRLISNAALGGNGANAESANGRAASGGSAEGGGAYVAGSITTMPFVEQNRAVGGRGGNAELWPGGGGYARGGGLAQAVTSTEPASVPSGFFNGNSALGGDSGSLTGCVANPSGALEAAGDASGGALAMPELVVSVPVDEGQGSFVASGNLARGGSSGVGACCATATNCRSPAPAGKALGGAVAAASAQLQPSQVGGFVGPIRFERNHAISGDGRACSARPCAAEETAPAAAAGGAIWVAGRVSSIGFTFAENSVVQGLGAPAPGGSARGGAVASDGDVQSSFDTYSGNTAVRGRGGAIDGNRVVVGAAQFPAILVSSFDANHADGVGGAISANTLEAYGVRATGNSARGLGGGALAAFFGATVVRSTIQRNSIELDPGLPAVPGGGGVLVFGQLTISDSNVLDNTACAATPNGICSGAGLRAGQLVADGVTIANNRVYGYTPAPANADSSHAGGGAGLSVSSAAALTNTTLSNNELVWTAPRRGASPHRSAPPLWLEH